MADNSEDAHNDGGPSPAEQRLMAQLLRLRRNGIISEEDFARRMAAIADRPGGPPPSSVAADAPPAADAPAPAPDVGPLGLPGTTATTCPRCAARMDPGAIKCDVCSYELGGDRNDEGEVSVAWDYADADADWSVDELAPVVRVEAARSAAPVPAAPPSNLTWKVGIVALGFIGFGVLSLARPPSTPSAAAVATEEPTREATAAPDPTPRSYNFKGAAHAQGDMEEKTVALTSGTWDLRWAATEPIADGGRVCGVTVGLYDASGDYAAGNEGWSEILDGPANGMLRYEDLSAGTYTLLVYMGCPWSVTIEPWP